MFAVHSWKPQNKPDNPAGLEPGMSVCERCHASHEGAVSAGDAPEDADHAEPRERVR